MELSVFISLLGALGVGSVLGQYVGAGRARREVRSAVLKDLASVEQQRWAGTAPAGDLRDFREAIHALEASALIARVPRQAVLHYVVFAQAAQYTTKKNYVDFKARGTGENVGGWLSVDFGRVVRDAAQIVTRLAWSPWSARISLARRLSKLRVQAAQLGGDERYQLDVAQSVFGVLPTPLGGPIDLAKGLRPKQ